jgi:uncharacterized OsmC-like protein
MNYKLGITLNIDFKGSLMETTNEEERTQIVQRVEKRCECSVSTKYFAMGVAGC